MKKIIFAILISLTIFWQKTIFAEEFFEWYNSFSNPIEIYDWNLTASTNNQDGVLRLTSSDNWCTTKMTSSLPKMEIKAMLKFKEGEGAFQVALGTGNQVIWSISFENNDVIKGAVWKSQILMPNNLSPRPVSEYNADNFTFGQWVPLSIQKTPKGLEIWLNHKMLEKINLSPAEMPINIRTTGLLQVECDEFVVRSLSSEAGNLDDSSLEKGGAIANGWTQVSGVWSTVLLPKTNALAICQSMETQAELVFVDELTEGSSISAQIRFGHHGQVGLGLRNEKSQQGLRVLLRQNSSYGLVGEIVNAGVASMSIRSSAQIFPGLWNHLRLHCRRGRIAIEFNGVFMGEMDCKQYGRPYLMSDGASSALFRDVKISGIKEVNPRSIPLIPLDDFIKSSTSTSVITASSKSMYGLPLDIGKPILLPTLLIEESKLIWKMNYINNGGLLNIDGLDVSRKRIFTSVLDFSKEDLLTWAVKSPPSEPLAEINRLNEWEIALQRIGQNLLLSVDGKVIGQLSLPKDCGPIAIELEGTQGDTILSALQYGWINAQKFDLWDESNFKTATTYWDLNFPKVLKVNHNKGKIEKHIERGPLGTIALKDQLGLNHRIFLQSRDAKNLPKARRHVVEWISDAQNMSVSIVLLDDGCEVQWSYNDKVIGRQRFETTQIQLLAGFDAQNKFRVWFNGQPLGEALDIGLRLWKFVLRSETEGAEQYWQKILWYNR